MNNQQQENTISVEMTAFEGICLIEAVNARIETFSKSPQRSEHTAEVRALHRFVTRMTPKVKEAVMREEAMP